MLGKKNWKNNFMHISFDKQFFAIVFENLQRCAGRKKYECANYQISIKPVFTTL